MSNDIEINIVVPLNVAYSHTAEEIANYIRESIENELDGEFSSGSLEEITFDFSY
jgi:hypothetical protein